MDSEEKNQQFERRLETVLRSTPFPGEEEEAIRAYLERVDFTGQVMERLTSLHPQGRTLAWAVIAVVNLLLLFFLGTHDNFLQVHLGVQEALSGYFFLFLGFSLLGCVVGFVLNLDTAWLHSLLERDA